MSCADILAKTYFHRVTARRQVSETAQETVCENAPCALSRSAHTSAPQPSDSGYVLPEARYRLSLFTRPELWFRLGDEAEITDYTGRIYRGICSDSVYYPSHCATVVEVRDITYPKENTDEAEVTP